MCCFRDNGCHFPGLGDKTGVEEQLEQLGKDGSQLDGTLSQDPSLELIWPGGFVKGWLVGGSK